MEEFSYRIIWFQDMDNTYFICALLVDGTVEQFAVYDSTLLIVFRFFNRICWVHVSNAWKLEILYHGDIKWIPVHKCKQLVFYKYLYQKAI